MSSPNPQPIIRTLSPGFTFVFLSKPLRKFVSSSAKNGGVLCLAGGCYEERGAVPLGPFNDALVDYWLAQPAERIRADLGNGLEDLGQVVPELRHYLKLSDARPNSPALDRTRAFSVVHACLRRLAERGPLLVCLEDGIDELRRRVPAGK